MNKQTIWSFIGAAALTVGLSSAARADAWDRDHEGGNRASEFRQTLNARERAPREVGRDLGRDNVTMGNIGGEFKHASDMTSHMNTHTQIRATPSDTLAENFADPTKHSATVSNPAAVAIMSDPGHAVRKPVSDDPPMSAAGTAIIGAAGGTLSGDTVTIGQPYRDFKNHADMLAHLNTQTAMRASASGEAGGEGEAMGGTANAGRSHVSDPTRMSDAARASLCKLGACFGKKTSSADVEDKTL